MTIDTAHLVAFSALFAGCLARNRAECLKLCIRGLVRVLMVAFAGFVAAIGSQVVLIAQLELLHAGQFAQLVCKDWVDTLAFLVAADELEGFIGSPGNLDGLWKVDSSGRTLRPGTYGRRYGR